MIKVVARTVVREECIEAYHELTREIDAETKKDHGTRNREKRNDAHYDTVR